MNIHDRISGLVTPPPDFLFDQATRDRLLFEVEGDFLHTKRYFWVYQSLALMNKEIEDILTAYRCTFTHEVWEGFSKTFWPSDLLTPKHAYWRKRIDAIKKDIEKSLGQWEKLERLNQDKMREIDGLRDNISSGTSAYQQAVAVMQGNNIKLLTLFTIFSLPLSFVTSVFGMTNMVSTSSFTHFGIVTVSICIPIYAFIGSLSTARGFLFRKIARLNSREVWKLRITSVLRVSKRLYSRKSNLVDWITTKDTAADPTASRRRTLRSMQAEPIV